MPVVGNTGIMRDFILRSIRFVLVYPVLQYSAFSAMMDYEYSQSAKSAVLAGRP